jgi:plastocyanin
MKTLKFIVPALLAGFTFVMMESCSKSDDYVAPVVADTSTFKINILATQFDPNTVTLHLGGKVTWTNTDTQLHSVVSDDATSFNSGNISAAGTYTFTPPTNGTYNYHCGIHPAVKGTIYVVTR